MKTTQNHICKYKKCDLNLANITKIAENGHKNNKNKWFFVDFPHKQSYNS